MSTELLLLARELFVWMLVLSLQLACILLLRKPLARYFGATVAYRLWILPLLWLPLHWVDWSAIEWSLPEFTWFAGDSPRGSVSWFPLVSQGVDVVLDLPEWAFSVQGAVRGWWLTTAALWFSIALMLLASIVLKTRSFARQLPRLSHDAKQATTLLPDSPFPPTLPVRQISGLQSPALYGVLRPQLLLPEDFTQRFAPRQRALILAHEAVHYRRRDNLWNLVACSLRLLFWFNPLLHLAWHKFRLDQEMSCDEQALQQAAQDEGKQYARTLLESAVWNTEAGSIGNSDALPTLTSWGRLSEIKERTHMIQHHLHNKPHSTAGRILLPLLTAAVLTLTAGLNGKFTQATAAEPSVEPEASPARVTIHEGEDAAAEYLPIVVIQPRYPVEALRENIEGWVSVNFTVNEAGNVVDPRVLESSPETVFDEASLRAVSRFKFPPRVVDGVPVQTPDVRYVFRFSVDD